MASIAEALTELGITEWVLRGEPTNETEFNEMFRKVTGADANGSAIESSNQADWGCSWATVSAKLTELNAAEPLKLLRAERTAYRQALRDITDSYTSLDDVVWPTKPE